MTRLCATSLLSLLSGVALAQDSGATTPVDAGDPVVDEWCEPHR